MNRKSIITFVAIYAVVAGIGFVAWQTAANPASAAPVPPTSRIIDADAIDSARSAVPAVGNQITHDLEIIFQQDVPNRTTSASASPRFDRGVI